MKKYRFIIISVLLIILVIIAIPSKNSWKYTAEQLLEEVQKRSYIVSVARYKAMLGDTSAPISLVDLRTADEYETAHLPDAINFNFPDDDLAYLHSFFGSLSGNIILYSDQTAEACEWWIVLKQIGFDNIHVLETGPDLNQLIVSWSSRNDRSIMTDEIPLFTFSPDSSLNIP